MAPVGNLLRRDMSSQVTTDLVIVFLVLLVVIISSIGALWFLHRIRSNREASLLPKRTDEEERLSVPTKRGHRRASGISIASTLSLEKQHAQSRFVDEEKQEFLANTTPPPSGGLPQIHVTFPEETDGTGKPQSGRVVVLHVDDRGNVGMAPVPESEQLPPYPHERFESLDLQRIGGLKEKEFSETKTSAITQ